MRFHLYATYFAINIFLCAVQAWARQPVTADARTQVEALPDGNVRDPKPSAEQIANLLANSKKNMIRLPGATFEMGDWGSAVNKGGLPFDNNRDSKPLHKVTLDTFSMEKFPVTYAEFDIFTAVLGLPRINQEKVFESFRKKNNPAGVSWQGAKDYCLWIGKELGLPIDLPSEAQWEFAARSGGKRHLFPTDNGKFEPGRNVPSVSQREAAGGMIAVGSFPPNSSGFYNFGAGIQEWTNDWYGENYYLISPILNPKGPSKGRARVVRGNFGTIVPNFMRWFREPKELLGTWTLYATKRGVDDKNIPYTRYSGEYDSTFRCVIN